MRPPSLVRASLALLPLALACASTGAGTPREARVAGARIHYENAGEGDEAIVLVHGWASSTETWSHQFPALAERARVLVLDLPGHGQSEAPDAPYTMALFADAVAAVMDAAGVERGVIVGHSNGAPVALNFYRRYPERTLAIVAVDGALKQVLTREQAEPMFAPLRGDGWREYLGGFLDRMSGTLSEEDAAAVRAMALDTPHEAIVGGFEAAVDPASWSEEPIDVPVLALLTAQPAWNADYEAWVRAHAPRLEYFVWQDTGHFLQMERPGELRVALTRFLHDYGLLPKS